MTAQPEAGWIPEDTLADRLFRVRRKLGLSQREAAIKTGIPYGSWQSMEDGRQARALDVKVTQISEALGVDRNWLMWGTGAPMPGQNTTARTPVGARAAEQLPRLDSNQQPADCGTRQLIAGFRTRIGSRRPGYVGHHPAHDRLLHSVDTTASTQVKCSPTFDGVCVESDREVA